MIVERTGAKGDFSKGGIPSTVMRLAIPVILAEIVQVLYNLVDRMYIGHIPSVGTEALTGVGIVLPVITVISAFANLCGYGGTTLSAIARGEGDDEKAVRILENAFTLLVACALVLTCVLYAVRRPLLTVLGADSVIMKYSLEYLDIYLAGTVFVMISLGMNSYITMQGYPVTGMWTVLIGAVTNIVLDPLFIFVLGMGARGAAIATVIAQLLSAIWVVLFLTGKKAPLRMKRLRLELKTTLQIMQLGVTGFTFKLTNSITQGLVTATLRLYGGAFGTLYIGSMAIINSIREVTSQPITGLTEAAKPVISYNYGAKEYNRVTKTIGFMIMCALAYNTLAWAAIMLFPRGLIGIFTNDNHLIEACVPCMRVYFCAYFMMSFQTGGQNTFVALRHPDYAVFFSLFRKVILVVPLTLILPRTGLGVMGVFWAEAVSQAVGGFCCFSVMLVKVFRPIARLGRDDYIESGVEKWKTRRLF